MAITREELCEAVKEVYGDIDKFLDDVKEGCSVRFTVFCTINESPSNSDVLILDTKNEKYIAWYKLSHLGRCIQTNLVFINDLTEFIQNFKESKEKERGDE